MAISFQKKSEFFTFHDPMQDGELIDRQTEVRFDPLTGESSRIIFDPGAPFTTPDYSDVAKKTSGKNCPFCSENVMNLTPTFPDELIAGGRMKKGEAVVFPNLFPYSKHNAVVRMTDQHYVPLEDFKPSLIENAFVAAHDYVQKVVQSDPKTAYASINWNYLPASGGSILHPHIHVLASEHPTNYQATTLAHGKSFYEQHRKNYYLALKAEEQQRNERWIGSEGSIAWVHAFAPKSHCDFIGIFDDAPSLSALTEKSWYVLAKSMTHLFGYFQQIGLASFNLAVFIPIKATPADWVHVRLIPRFTSGLLETSDMNVFNYLHQEPLSLKVPEQVAKDAAAFFQ
ncbi:hypothetical protein [Bacillus chungangensis]|uniref:Galactose-1-phosphate uridylyltransferase n=1 Tax=Bacillus chungangensis TaxID=587633 RepID=A0ABT9WTI6_9BACI|nr:hypothetical protein [Bacillus chungangensis]MDQ0176601.1 galactose-1-phosphate uridylyltransferase [Bacillus chungangensis]